MVLSDAILGRIIDTNTGYKYLKMSSETFEADAVFMK